MILTRNVRLGLILCLFLLPSRAAAEELVVAAASDLSGAVGEIVAGFEKGTGHKVRLTLGSSGNFHAQILNGAPFDVFLSADISYVRDLEKAGLADSGSGFVYAIGRIVLWTRRNSAFDLQALGMKSLLQPQIRKIAIANPEHAPYGRAAVSALQAAGIYDQVKTKFVLGENISQTAQFVQSGAADIGILALSLALSDAMKTHGAYWEIPVASYPRLEQGAVILKRAQRAGHSAAAREFIDYLRGAEGRAVLQRYGFSLPETAGTPK